MNRNKHELSKSHSRVVVNAKIYHIVRHLINEDNGSWRAFFNSALELQTSRFPYCNVKFVFRFKEAAQLARAIFDGLQNSLHWVFTHALVMKLACGQSPEGQGPAERAQASGSEDPEARRSLSWKAAIKRVFS